MENCQNVLKKANITPDLKLFTKKEGGGTQPTGPHTVKLIGDKVIKGTDFKTNEEIFLIRLFVEENGEKKKYDFPMKDKKGDVHYLVQRLAEYGEGSEIVLEGKSQRGKSFTEVRSLGSDSEISGENIPTMNEEDIPIIEEDVPSAKPVAKTPIKQKSDNDEIAVKDIPF